MANIEEIRLQWRGVDYVIPPRKIMGAILTIESVISLPEMAQASARGQVGRIASAFAAVLRYAGAAVEDIDVYRAMFGDEAGAAEIQTSIATLMAMMLPPPEMATGSEAAPVGKSAAAGN